MPSKVRLLRVQTEAAWRLDEDVAKRADFR